MKKSLVILFYSYAFGQVPGLVDVISLGYANVIGEQLHRDGVQHGRHQLVRLGNDDTVVGHFADDVISLGDHGDDLAFAGLHLLDIADDLRVIGVVGRDKYDGEGLVYEGDRPMLHFGGRVTFRMDIGDFLELQCAFEGYGEIVSPAEVEVRSSEPQAMTNCP